MVPGIHMYRAAVTAGVPLKPYASMRDTETRGFSPTSELLSAYNDYIASDSAGGSTDEVLSKRMDRYRYYRFCKLETFVEEARARGAPAADVKFLKETNEHFDDQCRALQRKVDNARREANRNRDAAYSKWYSGDRAKKFEAPASARRILERDLFKGDIEMWQAMQRSGETPPAVAKLFDLYVNDSMAGFAQDGLDEFEYNGRGLMRNRDVFDKGGA